MFRSEYVTFATRVIPETHADILDQKVLAHVATIGPDGEPQNNPVWFDTHDGNIRFSQTTTRQKIRNLQRDPRVAISIVDENNPYRYLEIRGTVERVDPDPDNAFINSMAKKYLGQDVYPWAQPGDERVVVIVRPEHTTQMG
jgi:PPOX class probable F420-dependent enzyme